MPKIQTTTHRRPPYDKRTIDEIRSWVAKCETWLEARDIIAGKLGIAPDNVTRGQRRFKFWTPKTGGDADAGRTVTESDDGLFDVEVQTSVPKTLDEVVRLCKVDLDKWEAKGFLMRRGAKGYAWSARFAAKDAPLDIRPYVSAYEQAVAKHAPKNWIYKQVNPKERDCLYVLNAHDLHMAKLAWSPETGFADWDIRIADRTYRATIDELMSKAPVHRIEEVVLIAGSDMMQVDNDRSSTSAGTYVDSDSRLPKIFDVSALMLTDVIEKLATQVRVRVVVIPGNHDAVTSYFIGRYLQAFFRNHPNVIVDATPKSRKYVPYGKTLIGFDHGDETNLKELPLLLMRENQATISQFKWQEVLTGHLHRESVDEYKGVKVRIAPALCSADKWHARKGFVLNLRQCQGLLYQRENGLEAIYYTTPLED